MRNAPGKTTGDILVPLYVEQAQGESLDAAVARAEFEEVWAVLQAMRRMTKSFNGSWLPQRAIQGFARIMNRYGFSED